MLSTLIGIILSPWKDWNIDLLNCDMISRDLTVILPRYAFVSNFKFLGLNRLQLLSSPTEQIMQSVPGDRLHGSTTMYVDLYSFKLYYCISAQCSLLTTLKKSIWRFTAEFIYSIHFSLHLSCCSNSILIYSIYSFFKSESNILRFSKFERSEEKWEFYLIHAFFEWYCS